jgi:PQQ-dependent dehydrogenase (methanol/ethanol family)
MDFRRAATVLVVAGMGTLLMAAAGLAAPSLTFGFTADQAERGRTVYGQQCASCHGGALEGRGAPALNGPAFAAKWLSGEHTFGDLDHAVRLMPKQAPSSLPARDYADAMAYILSANGYPAAAAANADMAAVIHPPPQAPPKAAAAPVALPAPPTVMGTPQAAWPTAAELLAPADSDWLMYNRTYQGVRFSPLAQINAGNAARLQPVCILQLGVLGAFEGSPLVYKGTAFVASAYAVYAFDAATCVRKWTYTYTPSGAEGFSTTRGVALADGKVIRGTPDGHLIALDAETGKMVWDTHVADGALGYAIGAAPVIYDGRVIVGLSGGDNGANGHIYAFDARTGQRLWTFDTIDKSKWTKGAEYGGGASWTTVAVDPKDGLVYAPVGNPAPDYYVAARPGDNLYSNSVVALSVATGKVAWYVQQVAADFHDWDTAAAPVLYEQDGHRYMAVANKGGQLFIYDRDSHKLVARADTVPRENTETPLSSTPLRVCPGSISGSLWNSPAYDPAAKALYVNTVDWCGTYTARPPEGKKPGVIYLEGDISMDPLEKASGWTRAFDAATAKPLWARQAPMPMTAAVTPTAGGVVLTGGGDGAFLVLDQRDGKTLYSFNLGGAAGGGVATYMAGGRQYVAVASGGFGLVPFGVIGAPTVVVFALPAEAR